MNVDRGKCVKQHRTVRTRVCATVSKLSTLPLLIRLQVWGGGRVAQALNMSDPPLAPAAVRCCSAIRIGQNPYFLTG